ncbi:MAG: glycosyltransferase family A protein [Bacteroidota bacterium]
MISVIMPFHNEETHIARAIQSCLDISAITELILIDDGSTDRSVEVLSNFHDHRLLLLHHQDGLQKGRSASRNLGILRATQPWIAFCDADDYYLPNRFAHLTWAENIQGYYDDIISETTGERMTNQDVTGIPTDLLPEQVADYLISHQENRISLLGLVVRREALLQQELFDTTLFTGEDTDLIWRLALRTTLQHGNSTSPVAIRGVDGSNVYLNEVKHIADKYAFYQKWYALLPELVLSSKGKQRITDAYIYYYVEHRMHRFPLWMRRLYRRILNVMS